MPYSKALSPQSINPQAQHHKQNPVNTYGHTHIQLVPSAQKSRTQVKVLVLQHRLSSLSCVSLCKGGLTLLTGA